MSIYADAEKKKSRECGRKAIGRGKKATAFTDKQKKRQARKTEEGGEEGKNGREGGSASKEKSQVVNEGKP